MTREVTGRRLLINGAALVMLCGGALSAVSCGASGGSGSGGPAGGVEEAEEVEICDATEYEGCPQRWEYLWADED